MKKKLFLGLFGVGLCLTPSNVLAASANVSVNGNNTVNVGENLKVSVQINNVKDTQDGVESFSGQVNYDKDLLEYVGVETNNSNYEFLVNEENLKLAALDYTMANGIKKDTIVYTFTFKTKGVGKTNITIDNLKITDSKAYLESSVDSLNVDIVNKPTTTAKTNLVSVVHSSKNSTTTTKTTSTSLTTKTTTKTNAIATTTNIVREKEDKKEQEEEKQTLIESIKNAISDFLSKIKSIFRA